MEQKTIEDLLGTHKFFEGMPDSDLATVSECGTNVVYEQGEVIAKTENPAEFFLAIREGRVAVEIYAPGKGSIQLETVSEGGVVGWSWLFEPYRWHFDIRAVEQTRAVKFCGTCLRGKCEGDTRLGYEFMKRFAAVAARRLEASRIQILDIYGKKTDELDHQG